MSGGQPPLQPEHRRNRRTPNKDSAHARGAFHQHRDEGERRLEELLPLTPDAPMYGRSQRNKARHERRRAGNTHRKTMDRARQPGLADRPPGAYPPSRRSLPSEEYFWRARRDRTR